MFYWCYFVLHICVLLLLSFLEFSCLFYIFDRFCFVAYLCLPVVDFLLHLYFTIVHCFTSLYYCYWIALHFCCYCCFYPSFVFLCVLLLILLYFMNLVDQQWINQEHNISVFKNLKVMVRVMMLNAIFTNISVISWRSDLLMEETASHWHT